MTFSIAKFTVLTVENVRNAKEINNTCIKKIRLEQSIYFESELKMLCRAEGVSNKSKLSLVNPFLDANTIIRVGK